MSRHRETHAKDSQGNLVSVHQSETDSPILPVAQIEKLQQFRPDLVDWVIAQTEAESNHRRSQTNQTNAYIFKEHIVGMLSAALLGTIGLGGAVYCVIKGHDTAGASLGALMIGTLAVAFLKPPTNKPN